MSGGGQAPAGKAFWWALVAGWGVIGFGLVGTVEEATRTHPGNFALWFVGSALAHDLLVAPAVFVLAILLGRAVPPRMRRAVQAGLVVAGGVTAVALPLLLGQGGAAGNPSALPRNYIAGWAVLMGLVLLGVLAGLRRRLRTPNPESADASG